MKLKTPWGNSLAIAGFTALYSCVIVPCQTFLANADQLPFPLGRLLCEYGFRFLVCFVVLSVLLTAVSRFTAIVHALVLGIAVCCILESGPLSLCLPEVNGSFEGYSSFPRTVLDTSAWIAVMVLAVCFRRWILEWCKVVVVALAVFTAAAIFDVRRPAVAISEDGLIAPPDTLRQDVVCCVRHSPARNTYVLILDSISSDVVEDILDHEEGLSDRFAGFTEYANNIGMQWMTAVAVPGIMTGRYYESGRELGQYGKAPWRAGSFVEEAICKEIPTYVNLAIGPKGYTNRGVEKNSPGVHFEKPSDYKMSGSFAWGVDEISVFRVMPYGFKGRYAFGLAQEALREVATSKRSVNIEDDRVIWKMLANAPIEPIFDNTLQVHHSVGGHEPALFDKNGASIPQNWAPSYSEYYGQCAYVLKLVAAFFDSLRRQGIYDRSNIILLGDHGIGNPRPGKEFHGVPHAAFPFLMVKAAGQNGRLRKSLIPTSHCKVAALARHFINGEELDNRDLDNLLLQTNRLCRSVAMGKITDYAVKADGTAVVTTREDREPDVQELAPLVSGKRYSFNIAERESYPDFSMINGSRDSHVGIDFYCAPMQFTVRVSPEMKKCDIHLLLHIWSAQKNLTVSANGGENLCIPENVCGDYPIVIRDVVVYGDGIVRVNMDHPREAGIVSVREIVIRDARY